jgi:pimeloyl-ACP methyl ester carboxylesterase
MKFPDRDVHFVASRDGTTIGYRRLGAGPPVAAIHGGLGTSASWRAVAERLADRFEFFLVDRRGRGASGAGTLPHSLGREVDDARAVLAAAGRGAALIGHSYGGAAALEAARIADRAEISRLVLYEPGVGVAGLIPSACDRAAARGGARSIKSRARGASARRSGRDLLDRPAGARRSRCLGLRSVALLDGRRTDAADDGGIEPGSRADELRGAG